MARSNEQRRVYRLPPCPAYDVEGMERWLSDLAEQGLLLAEDGFFAGVASFERGEARKAKYRLEAAQKSTGLFSDGCEPDGEQVALGEKYHWEYVGKRGDFYIYRSFDPEARELNTDPQVQALALNAVKKRQRDNVITLVLWLAVYPLLLLRGGVLSALLHMGTWRFALTAALVLWLIIDEIVALAALKELQRKLREDGCLQADKSWEKGTLPYHARRAVKAVLIAAVIVLLLLRWSDRMLNKGKVALDQYGGSVPFATMRDFADGEIQDYRVTMTGVGMGFNTIREWTDPLAPRCIDYAEHAALTLADGRTLSGGLYVDYYELASPALARCLAREIYRIDSYEKGFAPLDQPLPSADFSAVYSSTLHFPTMLVQQGKRVMRAYFYQSSDRFTIDTADWMAIMAESIAEEQ